MSNNPRPQSQKATASDTADFLLSLVIPCYNESARVDIMLQGIAEFNEKWKRSYEVIVVDDGSKDDTVAKIEEALNTKYPAIKDKIRIAKMPVNGGKGSALKQGVSLANGDYILTLDADMSTRPIELLNWERKEKDIFQREDTVFIGSRKHEEGKVEALQSRRIIGGVFNSIVQIFTTLQLKDTQCGFKLYPRKVATFLFGNMQSKGWAHDVELLYQADLNNIEIKEMPINWVNMPESKVNVMKDSIMMFFGVLAISFRIWLFNSFLLPFRMSADATPEQKRLIILRSVFNILGLLLIIGMPLMSFQFAVTGDEHWHFDYGNSIYNYFFHGDTEAQTATSGIQYYGGIFDFITAYVYNVFHLWDHYTTMHFINAIVGAIGIIYAGKLAKLFGGYSAGLLAVVFLVLSPSWFGHNFANPKDIPFSVGYTAGIYYILLFLKAMPNPTAKHVFGLICSIGWAMGVRIGGFLLIAYFAMFLGIYALYTKQLKAALKGRTIKQFIVIAIAGYLIAILFWPYAHLGIVSKPLEALKVMSNFFVNIGMLYEGKRILSNQVPWYYIPKYILYTAPLIVLAGAVIGSLGLVAIFRKNRNTLLFALFVVFACVFPWAYAVYKKSSLYDGWRHFLFIYPPLVVIAAIGWNALLNTGGKAVKYVVVLIIVAGLVLPAKYVAANHPFESLYYNEIAGGLKNIYGKYETDYYMLGIKPAAEWLLKNEHIENRKTVVATNCSYPLLADFYQTRYKNISGKDDKMLERYADFRHDEVYEQYKKEHPDFDNFGPSVLYVRYSALYEKDWDYCILFSRFVDAAELTSGHWPPVETIHTVTVDGVPVAAVLKRKTHKDFEGFELMKAQKISEAKEKFLESLQEYPTNQYVWGALVRIYGAEGKMDSALYAGRQALIVNPGNADIYQMLGSMLLKQHNADSALKLFKNLEQYDPGSSHYLSAYAYAVSGNGTAALNEIDAAIAANPYDQQPYKLGIQIAQQMHNPGKAEEYEESARKMFPAQEDQ